VWLWLCVVGGVAGGSKFSASKIFFKFANNDHNLYGTVDCANKALVHELHGRQYLNSAQEESGL
jgi:hypothetical protein